MNNPFYKFTPKNPKMGDLYVDVTSITEFFRDHENDETVVFTASESTWIIEEQPDYIFDCINNLITKEKYGFDNGE